MLRDVGARDQEHEADGAEQDEQGRPHVADDPLLERHDADVPVRAGELALERGR